MTYPCGPLYVFLANLYISVSIVHAVRDPKHILVQALKEMLKLLLLTLDFSRASLDVL
jgi:hypothetical protein